MKIRVLIADDHSITRLGIRNILEKAEDIAVVGEASDGLQALEQVQLLSPDILLVDYEMPLLNGIQVASLLREFDSSVKILVVSAYDDPQYVRSALKSGATGFISKREVPSRLIEAIHEIGADLEDQARAA